MREFLEHAAKKYYDGEPIISDEQFDVLADVYKFNDVGHKITDGIPPIFRCIPTVHLNQHLIFYHMLIVQNWMVLPYLFSM